MHAQNPPKLLRTVGLLAAGLFALALGWLCWQAWFDPRIQFLAPGAAPWIVYPSPPRVHTLPVQNLPAVFRRTFVLLSRPSKALLEWRCFHSGRLTINGQVVTLPPVSNWKKAVRIDVAGRLRPGTNELTATVWADTGPPALSLCLQTDEKALVTDGLWEASLAGALELPAALAAVPVAPQPGSPFLGAEDTAQAWRQTAAWQCCFFLVSLAGALLWQRCHPRTGEGGQKERHVRTAATAILAATWILLLVHNIQNLKWVFGFDSAAHLDYITYIQKTGSLPLANQGLEMFQAPLYYAIAAALLNAMHYTASDMAGVRLLQIFNLLVGAGSVALVWVGLGMLYPRQWKKQLAGAMLAAYTPWQLYLLHYPINEILSCMLGTAVLCLCLKCLGGGRCRQAAKLGAGSAASGRKLRQKNGPTRVSTQQGLAMAEQPAAGMLEQAGVSPAVLENSHWPVGWLAALGIALGAACLAKASSLALLPLVFAALTVQLIARGERAPMTWLKVIGLVFGLALAISAWHYWRAWQHFGNPFLGGWSRESIPAPWWQQPGYATVTYFLRFGHCLIAPYFCGLHGFWNGVYSTLWGDGGRGGADRVWLGTPWNDDFMTIGYVWALVPSFLVLSGIGATVARLIKNPRLDWLLLTAAAATYFLALLQLNLTLPYLACGKASYALTALLPFCAFAVSGLDWWVARFGSWAALVFTALLGAWLINDYAAFWVQPDAPRTRLLAARQKYIEGREDPSSDFLRLVEANPQDSGAAEFLARTQLRAGRTNDFEATLEHARRENAVNAQLSVLAVKHLVQLHRMADALRMAKEAAHKTPDDPQIAETWLILAEAGPDASETAAAAEWFLRLAPEDLSAHKRLADALARLGQPETSAWQRAIARGAGL